MSDLQQLGLPPRIAALQNLSAARQGNVLRHWLAAHCATQASSVQLAELQKQIAACQTRGHQIGIKVGKGTVLRVGGTLVFMAA